MKKDINLLTSKFYNTMYNKAANLIATECFIKSIPVDCGAKEKQSLAQMANSIYNRIEVGTLIKSGMKAANESEDYKTLALLKKFDVAIEAVVNKAKERVVKSGDIFADDEEICKFNAEEISEFTAARKELDVDDIANIVKNKVIQTIKDEKAAYEKEDKIRKEIQEVIKDDTSDAVESYMDIVLKKSDARHHISLFSRLTDVSMDAFMHTTEDSDCYAVIEAVGFDSKLIPENTAISLENMITSSAAIIPCKLSQDEMGEKLQESSDKAFMSATCILTILEVLKTCRLYNPEAKNMTAYIEKPGTASGIINGKLECLGNAINDMCDFINRNRKDFTEHMVEYYRSIVKTVIAKTSTIDINDVNYQTNRSRILTKCNDVMELLDACNTVKNENPLEKLLGYYELRQVEALTMELSKYFKLISSNRLNKSIEVRYSSDVDLRDVDGSTYINIHGINEDGKPSTSYSMKITAIAKLSTNLDEFVRYLIDKVDAKYCNTLPVIVYHTNTNRSYNMNK